MVVNMFVRSLILFSLCIIDISISLKVSVYYESLCSDSIAFIKNQLVPNYPLISQYINIDFIPYGKEKTTQVNPYNFTCQHGSKECKGNKYHGCVLAHNTNQSKNVEFVCCIMTTPDPALYEYVEHCARKLELDTTEIESCSNSEEGDKIMAENGLRISERVPSISFVPTITYDDKYDQEFQDASLKDLLAVVCVKLQQEKPSVCTNKKMPKKGWWFW